MAEIKALKIKPAASHKDIIDFVHSLMEKCRSENVTSLGICFCYNDGENGFIGYNHISLDPEDQEDFETAALELRHNIIDTENDYEIIE